MTESKLQDFESIDLKEMDSVKLMNRKECKYTLSYPQMLKLLDRAKENYYILDIGGKKLMPYESVYYDMPKFDLYTSHQNGKQNRYKVRSRTYGLTGDSFLELKFKNNKKRTIKKRIKLKGDSTVLDHREFLEANLPFSSGELEKKIIVKYKRITLVDKQ
ncbi:MAG: VTC domain-containing protein, partial [Spirochaetaceae bacterium]|nr:VTC domain-containing protein [Spirochaetaceae bacterium]